jgi:putative chitinase
MSTTLPQPVEPPIVTRRLLVAVMPKAKSARLDAMLPHLTSAALEFGINTRERLAAWLAQLAHESAELKYLEEIADGSAYEGREDLGNTKPGDGRRYKGRGPIQITGRANYAAAGKALGLDLVAKPELLATNYAAGCRAAAWFWKSKGLNELADKDAFGSITKRVNGGFNGLDDRCLYWARANRFLWSVK